VGKASDLQKRAYETSLEMHKAVINATRPGTSTRRLVEIADEIARDAGLDFYHRFLGHGLGIDVHERPDMGVEDMELATNMVLAVEPHIAIEGSYLLGNEDMVLVTEAGGESLTQFPKTPLEL
jgi:Xaa-Pro aminopeptidase